MPEKIQVMIVEDEAIVAADLAEQLEMEGYAVTGIADNYKDALELFSNNPVDILLMDIHIRGTIDGVETATQLLKIKTVPLIYITAFTDTATIERVKHTHPAAFLVKPYEFENVRIAIDLALHNFAAVPAEKTTESSAQPEDKHLDKTLFFQLGNHLFIKQNYKFFKFSVTEIVFAETDNNYVILHTRTQKFVVRLSLGELLERINYPSFIRIHRSFAVNLNEIVYFDEQTVKIGQREFPLGRNYRQGFLDNFNPR